LSGLGEEGGLPNGVDGTDGRYRMYLRKGKSERGEG